MDITQEDVNYCEYCETNFVVGDDCECYTKDMKKSVLVNDKDYKKLVKLADQTLHAAYIWNDHNFDHPAVMARHTADLLGIPNVDAARNFINGLPKPTNRSNTMHEQDLEKEIQTKNLNAPRLTPALIDASYCW